MRTSRASRLEAVWAVEDGEEGLVVDLARRGRYDLCDLCLCRVLAQRAEEVAEGLAGDGADALLVEQRERLFVLCARVDVKTGLRERC